MDNGQTIFDLINRSETKENWNSSLNLKVYSDFEGSSTIRQMLKKFDKMTHFDFKCVTRATAVEDRMSIAHGIE